MTQIGHQPGLFDVAPEGTRDAVREQLAQQLITEMRKHPRWRADEVVDHRLAIDIMDLYPGRADLIPQVVAWRTHSTTRQNPGRSTNRTERLRAQLINWLTPRAQRYRPGGGTPAGGARAGAGRTRPAPRPAAAFDGYTADPSGRW